MSAEHAQVGWCPLERLEFPLEKEKWGDFGAGSLWLWFLPFLHVHHTHEVCIFLSPGLLFREISVILEQLPMGARVLCLTLICT